MVNILFLFSRVFSRVLQIIPFLMATIIHAQDSAIKPSTETNTEPPIIQLSGWVSTYLEDEQLVALPGVYIYMPTLAWGTITDFNGFFSLAVPAGQEVVVHSVGFENQTIDIPLLQTEDLTKRIHLVPDTVVMQEVVLHPLPSEEILKKNS